jgi:hypothetical protein
MPVMTQLARAEDSRCPILPLTSAAGRAGKGLDIHILGGLFESKYEDCWKWNVPRQVILKDDLIWPMAPMWGACPGADFV